MLTVKEFNNLYIAHRREQAKKNKTMGSKGIQHRIGENNKTNQNFKANRYRSALL